MVNIYTKKEIEKIRESGKILRETLNKVKSMLEPDINTKMIDELVYKNITKHNAYPVFLGYSGFPASACISINEEIIHGIPDKNVLLKEGDIISVDVGVKYNGYIADAASTFGVGNISPDAEKIMKVTYNSLYNAIKKAKIGFRLGDIGYAVQSYAESFGYNVIREFVGHGVGIELHEEPQVPNYGKSGVGLRLKPGMVIAIEPMISVGAADVYLKDNGWTVVTADNSLAAHFEHTIAITDSQPLILTI